MPNLIPQLIKISFDQVAVAQPREQQNVADNNGYLYRVDIILDFDKDIPGEGDFNNGIEGMYRQGITVGQD